MPNNRQKHLDHLNNLLSNNSSVTKEQKNTEDPKEVESKKANAQLYEDYFSSEINHNNVNFSSFHSRKQSLSNTQSHSIENSDEILRHSAKYKTEIISPKEGRFWISLALTSIFFSYLFFFYSFNSLQQFPDITINLWKAVPVILYGICISISLAIMLNSHFKHFFAYPFLVIAAALSFGQHASIQIYILLFILVMQIACFEIPIIKAKSYPILISLSLLLATTIPITFIYGQTHFLSIKNINIVAPFFMLWLLIIATLLSNQITVKIISSLAAIFSIIFLIQSHLNWTIVPIIVFIFLIWIAQFTKLRYYYWFPNLILAFACLLITLI